jgi:glycosyltransferase involved in cell wall biosynthesis
MRIVYACNLMIRRFGTWKFFTDIKLLNGMIRNNWNVCTFSDRDIARFTAPLHIKPLGLRAANRHFIETCENFRPDIVILGHSDILTNRTLLEIKRKMPGVPIIFYNIDALWLPKNVDKINHRKEVVDAIFLTTGGEALKQFETGKNIVGYIPNAIDPAIDQLDNSKKTEFERDLMYCGKGDKSDERYPLIVSLHKKLKEKLRFDTYGIYGNPEVWGEQYEQIMGTSKMALNLNRVEGWPLYSSDRIAQLMGNGLLTFLWDKGGMRSLFTDNHVAFFKDEDELVRKVVEFQNDDAKRQATAAAGRAFYHEHFSAQHIAKFIVESVFNEPYSQQYVWIK